MSEYLPQEVVAKILTKLPPKPLIKFRCVSKSWNSLITSPEFISMHTQETSLSRSSSGSNEIMIRRYSKAHNSEVYTVHVDNKEFPSDNYIRIEYPFHDDTRFYYRIVGSSNGLLCLVDDLFGQADSIVLWNPVIKRKLKLSVRQTMFDSNWMYMFVVGFGYDVKNNDYKVVRIDYALGDYGCAAAPPNVEVYALSERNWHRVECEIPTNCVVEYFWSQVFINGSVHWAAFKNMGKKHKLVNFIMLFNMTHEVFDEMPLPAALEDQLPINLNIILLKDSVAIVQYNDDERICSKSCCIWVMNEYGNSESWSKQYNIDVKEGLGMILGVRTIGDVLLTANDRGLVSYNPLTGVYADLGLFGTKESFYVGAYSESLALLAEGREARERIPSDTETESECESSVEDDDDRFGDVEKGEFWRQCTMSQYLTAMLRRPFL